MTLDEKKSIARSIVSRKHGNVEEKQRELKHEIADWLYCKMYAPATLKKMKALPKGWLPKDDDVNLSTKNYGYQYLSFANNENRIFLAKDTDGYPQISDKIMEELEGKIAKKEKFGEDFQDDLNEILPIVKSYTSASSLIKAWPEIEHIVVDCVSDGASRNVPAPIINEMTEKYNLPPEDDLAAA
jgi:hypothetical protein